MTDLNLPTETLDLISQKKREIAELQVRYSRELKASMTGIFSTFFDKHPGVTALQWVQYTPYFNDGEPCEFGVHGMEVFFDDSYETSRHPDENIGLLHRLLNGSQSVQGKHERYNYSWDYTHIAPHLSQALLDDLEKISEIVSDEDTMEDIFGDHVKVTVTKNGIEVEDFDHD